MYLLTRFRENRDAKRGGISTSTAPFELDRDERGEKSETYAVVLQETEILTVHNDGTVP